MDDPRPPAPFGISVETAPGRATARLSIDPSMYNPNGVVHGGVLFTLVDWAMGAATHTAVAEGQFCASIDVHLRFFRPVTEGDLRADVEVVRAGKRIVNLEGRVHDDDGTLVATATGAFAVLGVPV